MSYFDFVEQDRGYTPGMSGEPAGMSERGYADDWAPPGAIRDGLVGLVQEPPSSIPPQQVRQVEADAPSPFAPFTPFGRGSSVVDPTIWSDMFENLF